MGIIAGKVVYMYGLWKICENIALIRSNDVYTILTLIYILLGLCMMLAGNIE